MESSSCSVKLVVVVDGGHQHPDQVVLVAVAMKHDEPRHQPAQPGVIGRIDRKHVPGEGGDRQAGVRHVGILVEPDRLPPTSPSL